MQFLDAHSFELRTIKKSCVHVATPEGHSVPLDTFNLFYRGASERTRLEDLRAEALR